ncbi:hypothetical protein GCM10011352_04630 [Marinobacterium zhoushanense]|uniref:Uncharacterized protein n=1 Tax=Marinobacterium zhoushanense TaxID=1679163 RepID=A0ABQ1JZY4_9GAMM|nr:hypothetical protein [Marinobacterium zhoushanense]GGB81926.1 hypothetical protein GCM10011352_04630 [Marinobacterium zhoushanense]
MDNRLLFPSTAQLSLSKIENPTKSSDTLSILRSIVHSNDAEPYIGVVWEDAGEKVEIYFCFTSLIGAHQFKRSISAGLGSVISYPHVDLFDGKGIKSQYTSALLDSGIKAILRVSIYSVAELQRRWGLSFTKSERIKKINWLLERSLLIKTLLQTKPALTTSAEHSLATLLNRFFVSYTTNSINEIVNTLEQLDTGGYLDARNISFLRLLKMDALGQYSDVLLDEEIGDIVRGRMSSEVHRVVLKSLYSVYGLKYTDYSRVDEADPKSIEELKDKLDDWRPVFKSNPSNPSVFDSSEIVFHSFGRHILGYEASHESNEENTISDSVDLLVAEQIEDSDSSNATGSHTTDVFESIAINSWQSWLEAGSSAQDWSDYSAVLREEGFNWNVDAAVVDKYLSVLDALNDDISAQLINDSFAIFIESLHRQFSKESFTSDQILRLSEEFALTSHRASEDYRLYRFMLEMLFRGNLRDQDMNDQWQILEHFIETRGITVFNLPDVMSVLEYLIDGLPRYDANVLNVWNRYVVPFASNNSRLSGADLLILDSIGAYIQQNYVPFASENELMGASNLVAVEANIGVYSLDKTALGRVVETIKKIYPSVTIRENSDSVCTSALEQLAKTTDVMFFAASKAKHAAFYCVQNAKAKIFYPQGKGSTAMVRAIEEYLVGLTV